MNQPKSIEAYIEELRRFQAAATPAPSPQPTPIALQSESESQPEPEPQPTPPSAPPTEPIDIPANEFRRDMWNPTPEESGTGFLQIRVTTGRGALPIEGARVVVARPDEYQNPNRLVMETDADGSTPFIALPTVDKSLSQRPSLTRPFSTYDIRTEAPNQLTVINLHVPIFDEVSSIQRVDMVGPEENYSGDGIVIFDDTAISRINGQ